MTRHASEISAQVMAEFERAEHRPRLHCRDCGQATVLDIAFMRGTEPVCDTCQTKRDEQKQQRELWKEFRASQEASGIPAAYRDMKLAEYHCDTPAPDGTPVSAAVQAMRTAIWTCFNRYCTPDAPTHGAFIQGPAGTGKTLLTVMLANRFCYHGYRVKWLNGYSLSRDITDEWKQTSRERAHTERLAADIAAHDVVFWEDMQIPDPVYAWYAEAVNDILNEITLANRLLFVTTNHRRKRDLLIDETRQPMRGQSPKLWLEQAYGEKFLSRLDALCKRFPLTGPDMRVQP